MKRIPEGPMTVRTAVHRAFRACAAIASVLSPARKRIAAELLFHSEHEVEIQSCTKGDGVSPPVDAAELTRVATRDPATGGAKAGTKTGTPDAATDRATAVSA